MKTDEFKLAAKTLGVSESTLREMINAMETFDKIIKMESIDVGRKLEKLGVPPDAIPEILVKQVIATGEGMVMMISMMQLIQKVTFNS